MTAEDSTRSVAALPADRTLAPTRSYRLSDQDALFIYAEGESNPLHIGSIGIFDGRLDFAQLKEHIASRLHLVPRYRQRLRRTPFNLAHPVMEDDPGFRIENHVFRHPLGRGIHEPDAIEEMMRCFELRLDRSHPLWQIHVFEGLEDERTALVSKVHHALVDGIAGVELLKVMLDPAPNMQPVEAPSFEPQAPSSRFQRLAAALRQQAAKPLRIMRQCEPGSKGLDENLKMIAGSARLLAEFVKQPIVSAPWNAGLVSRRRLLKWSRFPFAEVEAIRGALGGSVNDVALTALTEAAARYLAHHGHRVEGRFIRVGCPVNVRRQQEQSALGNRVSMVFPMMPAWPMGVAERLRLVSRETRHIKDARLAQALERLMALGGELTPPFLTSLASRTGIAALGSFSLLLRASDYRPRPDRVAVPSFGINFLATNIRGIQMPLYILGHRCSAQIPLVPLAATLGYAVAILSYDQSLFFGMLADPYLMPDLALMKSFVEQAFNELSSRRLLKQAEAGIAAAR
ncbi:MAG: wax ester/triacylglycerol synthase domain-containing protein [Candidatus Binataceae bacterium]